MVKTAKAHGAGKLFLQQFSIAEDRSVRRNGPSVTTIAGSANKKGGKK